MAPRREPVSPALAALADAYGVATSYENYRREPQDVSAVGVRAALTAMGIEVGGLDDGDDDAVEEALAATRDRAATLPPTVVAALGEPLDLPGDTTEVDGRPLDPRKPLRDLELGSHRLRVPAGEAELLVVPARCPQPLDRPGWGWMVQLYSARSQASWGFGDLADLSTLVEWAAGDGAAFVMVNPLHAAAPVIPQQDSPYYPASRRFTNPLYLRVEDLPEYAALGPDDRDRVAGLAEAARAGSTDRIDRDAVFKAKDEALRLLHAAPATDHRAAALDAYRRERGDSLRDFATYCAIAERHGADWHQWPDGLRHPAGAGAAGIRQGLAASVEFHQWVQLRCAEQLAQGQDRARGLGMPVGVIHDLAVGVDPGGADAWALQDDLALSVTVGAPPDEFNQRGQDWGLPPLLPTRLIDTGYAAFRDMAAAVLRHAGGIRIDHIMGLWRLWWVPEGRSPAEGTYVRYPADALVGLLALEAQRTGALVVGEDLGTVEEGVRATMARRGVIGSRVLYFERTDEEDARRLRAEEYDHPVLASVNTHDLPTAPGWWADEGLSVQVELGLLPEGADVAAERRRAAAERDELRRLLEDEGVWDPADPVASMYAFLAKTPALLVAASLRDGLGDVRQPNMPATTDEYPNWRLPLGDETGAAQILEAVLEHPGVRRLADLLRASRPR